MKPCLVCPKGFLTVPRARLRMAVNCAPRNRARGTGGHRHSSQFENAEIPADGQKCAGAQKRGTVPFVPPRPA